MDQKRPLTQVAPDPAVPGANAGRKSLSKVTISEGKICKPAGSGEQTVGLHLAKISGNFIMEIKINALK